MKAFVSTASYLFRETSVIPGDEGHQIILDDKPMQKVIGFGGAITESSAHVYASLSTSEQKELLKLLYSKEGLNYSLARLTIGSCDFSLGEYDYASKDDLSDFSLAHDKKEIIPFLKDAFAIRPLKLLASSWSPLARWKNNKNKCGGGYLLPECYDIYASYIKKYVEGYGELKLPIRALTIQNEPEATQTWESCLFSSEEEAKLLIALHKILPNVNLYVHDHNRDHMLERSQEILASREAFNAAKGIAYHWYDRDKYIEVEKTHEAFPNKTLIFTEGCIETLVGDYTGPKSFASALRYAKNYGLGLNYGTSAFLDWNVLLDERGGPNHVGNFCEAPIMRQKGGLLLNPSFFAIKHFSFFIELGAYVTKATIKGPCKGLIVTSVINPNNSRVIILINEGKDIKVSITSYGSILLPSCSIATIIF